MIRKYHDHKLHTNPRHCEEDLQDIYSNIHLEFTSCFSAVVISMSVKASLVIALGILLDCCYLVTLTYFTCSSDLDMNLCGIQQ